MRLRQSVKGKTVFRLLPVILCALMLSFPAASYAQGDEKPDVITEKHVLNYLEDIIAWQRDISTLEMSAENSLEKLLQDSVQQNAKNVLVYGFGYARAQAQALSVTPKEKFGPNPEQVDMQTRIRQTAAELQISIPKLKEQLATLTAQISSASAKRRPELELMKEKVSGELKLSKARYDLLKSVISLFNANGQEKADTLVAKIDNLASGIPELQPAVPVSKTDTTTKDTGKTTKAAAMPSLPLMPVAAPDASFGDQPSDEVSRNGILRLGTDILTQYRKSNQLHTLENETEALLEHNQRLVDSLRVALQDSIQRGNALTQAEDRSGGTDIMARRAEIDALVDNFKQLSASVLPLAQTRTFLTNGQKNLQEWHGLVDKKFSQDLRHVSWRLVILALALVIPFFLSELAHRATQKYVHDVRRQRQLRIIRRIVFGVVIGLIVMLNFVTEFGSFATYAGFLTAGLAVALQNVILSMVSYFFYFGRFGVRVGDRVTVKDITGEVVQVGLIRLYLMELTKSGSDYHPTGKIVAFPNSILFQPNAFSKQISGTNYTWQETSFVLDEKVNPDFVNEKILKAVNDAYSEYHDLMRYQESSLIHATHLNVKIPSPYTQISFTDKGLTCLVRYPIERTHAAELSGRITQKIIDVISHEPSLRLVLSSNPPRIEALVQED